MVNHMMDILEQWLNKYSKGNMRMILIRWFYTQKLSDYDPKDPVFPINLNRNEGLWYEILKEKVPISEIPNIENLVQQLSLSFIDRQITDPILDVGYSSYITHNRNAVNVHSGGYRTELSPDFYNKLKKMYTETGIGESTDLAKHIFNLLNRYQTLYAPGYHAAIPEKVFSLLRETLKVNHEVFASPFNNTMSSYTSAYPDVDKYFGSKGNFFEVCSELLKDGGSFEANPPFLEEHMAALAIIIEENLKREVPFSFVVIVPAWKDTLSYNIFMKSEYNLLPNGYIALERLYHYYRNGSQSFNVKDTLRKSNSNSLIFILQNKLGNLEYPVTDDLVVKLKRAFYDGD